MENKPRINYIFSRLYIISFLESCPVDSVSRNLQKLQIIDNVFLNRSTIFAKPAKP